MQPLWRILIASALASASTGALAQSAPTEAPANAPASPPADPIGPPQLSNFSLGGKVTQSAQQPTQIQPTPKTPRLRSGSQVLSPPASVAEPAAKAPAPVQTAQLKRARSASTPSPRRGAEATAPPVSGAPVVPPPQAAPSPSLAVTEPSAGTAQSGRFSLFLWLLAVAAAGGAAAWYFLWQRPRTHLAPAGVASAFEAQTAKPLPPAAPPRGAPPPITPKSSGVVATRLRPWVELQFAPGRIILDGEKALLEFEMTLFNSGNAPARDVLVEGSLFNAGPMQDEQIARFFQNPVGQGNRLPLLAPLQRLSVNSAIALSKAQLVPLEMEGHFLFVPLAGFNTLYHWGSGRDGQTSTSYLVGKQTDGAKLAPFRLDIGPRVFRRLAAREYELRVRQ